ncbi:DNA primase [Chitinimonas taiwanensis]|uniref:DNA primase n=1 Tax=Chitinimonas taiwanensis TaxID=240412 RepID=UPI0035AF7C63
MIPQDFLDTLLQRLDIVDVIDRYVPLKKAGQNYGACCPFHKEKSPSFTVSQQKQFYHCFGCGAHGSAIGFVEAFEGLSFPEAVEKLAGSIGLQVPRQEARPQDAGRRRVVATALDVLASAQRFYAGQLKGAPAAVDYLKGRGLTGDIAARFGLGYAPAKLGLEGAFSDYRSSAALRDAGLVIDQEDTGRRYDRFRDRITFPILDDRGQVIGFGGRVMNPEHSPKYLNSPETSVFHKGQELYGLYQAKAAIRAADRVLVVEGYMDVVALAQHGVEYAVATLGTACTSDQVRKLLRLADQVVFCFDGDAAGKRAAWRALENALPMVQDGKAVEFLFLPAEHDPDSYVRTHGRADFVGLLERDTFPLSSWLFLQLAEQASLATAEGRAAYLKLATPLIAQVQAPALRTVLTHQLADYVQLPVEAIANLIPSAPVAGVRTERMPAGTAGQLLQLAAFWPALTAGMPMVHTGTGNTEPALAALQRIADLVADSPTPPNSAQLLEALQHDDHLPAIRTAFFAAFAANTRAKAADIQRQWGELLPALLAQLPGEAI